MAESYTVLRMTEHQLCNLRDGFCIYVAYGFSCLSENLRDLEQIRGTYINNLSPKYIGFMQGSAQIMYNAAGAKSITAMLNVNFMLVEMFWIETLRLGTGGGGTSGNELRPIFLESQLHV